MSASRHAGNGQRAFGAGQRDSVAPPPPEQLAAKG